MKKGKIKFLKRTAEFLKRRIEVLEKRIAFVEGLIPSTVCERNVDKNGKKVRFNVTVTSDSHYLDLECEHLHDKKCLLKVEENKDQEDEKKLIPERCDVLGKNYMNMEHPEEKKEADPKAAE